MGATIAVGVFLGLTYLFLGMITLCIMDDVDLVHHRWVIVATFLVWPFVVFTLLTAHLFRPVVDMWKELGRKR